MSQIPLTATPSDLHANNAFVDMRRRVLVVPIAAPIVGTFRIVQIPCSGRLHTVRATVRDAGATGATIDIQRNAVTLLDAPIDLALDGDAIDGVFDADLEDTNGGILLAVNDVITAVISAVDAAALDVTVELDYSV